MIGLIAGDTIGSTREGRKSHFNEQGLIVATEKNATITPLDAPEPMLHEGLSFTDDSVLALATDKALRTAPSVRAPFADNYATFFDLHSEPNEFYKGHGIGYGPMFMEWADKWNRGEKFYGYGSYGNGSAMRVGPVAYHFERMIDVINVAHASAVCTHNNPLGIYWAQMLALSIFLARQGASAQEIRVIIQENSEATFEFNEEQLVKHYVFSPTCQGSVPQAIWAALEGPDFMSVMRRCLRIGGDTDTICAMAGALSEVLWGVPDEIAKTTLRILERDGPYLYEEYQLAVEGNSNYINYFNITQERPTVVSKLLSPLLSFLKKKPS